MLNIYDFIDACRDEGMTAQEALEEYERARAEEAEAFYERYYDDPMVQEGWAQQDVIDMYRRER